MFDCIIYSNEYLLLIVEEEQVYIKVIKKGFSVNAFNDILKEFPRIKISQFAALKASITNALSQIIKIGNYKPIIEISVSKDRLKAFVTINLTDEEFNRQDKNKLLEKIIIESNSEGIGYGFDLNNLVKHMKPQEKLVIANGLLPQKGDDAIIRLYELEEIKPQIFQDGKVNYYELNLINKVNKEDWVGERIEPKEGTSGKTVYGEIIPAQRGMQEKLKYDKKTIKETFDKEKGITTLRAKKVGAVVYEKGIISICNYLEIDGRVSFATGNVDFDGYVEIKESIEDNFCVRADNDIQIMGNMGIGGVETIESRDGSIYIRGGIAGKNKAKIICTGDLYTKFASNCTIECDGTVNIGYYTMNSNIKAKEIILESLNSKIIGGNIEAKVRVLTGEIGSRAEVVTNITITGFKRSKIKEEYDMMAIAIDKVKDKVNFLKQQIWIYTGNNLNTEQRQTLEALETEYDKYNKKLRLLYEKRKKYISYLHAKGEGEVRINSGIYPNVNIRIKDHCINIHQHKQLPISYYAIDNELKIL